ncbi:hypothetical protein JCM10450v2_002695 [Rhodotorula kratochvilovae]
MHATLALATLASLASVAVAQIPGGYGRFPCTLVNGDSTLGPDPNQCLDDALLNPAGEPSPGEGLQGAEPNPTGAECVEETETGAFFCGIAGARCTSDANCDNGSCDIASGLCQGGFLQDCGGADTGCSGFLYCQSPDQSVTYTCGADGAFCQDPFAGGEDVSDAELAAIYDQFCQSGYCSGADGACARRLTEVGADCSQDALACGTTAEGIPLTCVVANGEATCQAASASVLTRTRSRRASLHRRNLCPASHTACSVEGAKGFECIDVTSNIEQCGACASQGGVDCTAIEGVAAVGCVAGTCEIWSCEDGFTYDAAAAACTKA